MKIAGVGLHTIAWAKRDVGEFVRALQQEFMYKGKVPSPGQMLALLDFLDLLVLWSKALNLSAWAATSSFFPFSTFVDQPGHQLTSADISAWENRSSDYRAVIAAAGDDGMAIFDDVTAPLITGHYPDGRDTFPDAATPVVISHMAQVSVSAMGDALSQYYKDIARNARDMAQRATEGAKGTTSQIFRFLDWVFDPENRHRLLVFPLGVGGAGLAYGVLPRLLVRVISR